MTSEIDTGTPCLLAETDCRIGWITCNDPLRHNAMTSAMWRAIPLAMAGLLASPNVRVIILAGAGNKSFVSGADITEFDAHADNPESALAYEETLKKALSALRNSPRPVIAMINGYCIGGGMSLALAADFRIASDDARFSIPAARLGLAYPRHAIADLTSVAGLSLAKELLFTARHLDADEALSRGLINQIALKGDLETETRQLAAVLANNAPLTISAAKKAIDFIVKAIGSEAEIDRLADDCAKSRDYREGRAAFAEKRRPQFNGD